ncbi:MAG: glycosyltransferase family 9 protein [Bacillota bacterium]|nr:glycosyltransferase family 9 protein [Bacillota bacterium]
MAGAAFRRILTLHLSPLGDTLFATPALRALRHGFPGAEVTAVAWRTNAPLLADNPNLDRLLPCAGLWEVAQFLREEKGFDLVVGLSHLGSWAALLCEGAPRVGFNARRLGRFYCTRVPDRRDVHAVEYCLAVVEAVGARRQGTGLELALGERERAFAAELLAAAGCGPGPSRAPLVAIHPGGRTFRRKRWPAKRFAAVADRLAREWGARVVLVGGREDVPLGEEIATLMRKKPLMAVGRASLKQTAALLEASSLFIGNDSAPQHMAAAVGTPVIGLFGPTDPRNFAPLGSGHRVLRKEWPCSPCFRWLGGFGQYVYPWLAAGCRGECMLAITVEDVVAAAGEYLARLAGGT